MKETTSVSVDSSPQGADFLQLQGIVKSYQTKNGTVLALNNVSLDITRGEFIALVGPSGCGKSTLLHIIAGLVDQDQGTALIGGMSPKAGRKDVSIMFQRPVLLPWRTVLENTMLPTELRKMNKSDSQQRAMELLDLVGLTGFEEKHVWELSGGMRQRVSLAQSLVTDAPLLLMDEPFSAVDEFTRERLNLEVARMHADSSRTTVYVTHNIQEAVFLADRVVAMKPRPGEIVEITEVDQGPVRDLDFLDSELFHRKVAEVRKVLSDYTGGVK
jgi:NitT/TauT family transport system ATP-binding protein